MNTGSCLAFCQTRTHETAMSTISVWDIDLGNAVMGVTRRRDGFRYISDERSKGTVAVCFSQWKKVPQAGANKLRNRPLATMIFSAARPVSVAILSYARPLFSQRHSSCLWRRPDPGRPALGHLYRLRKEQVSTPSRLSC